MNNPKALILLRSSRICSSKQKSLSLSNFALPKLKYCQTNVVQKHSVTKLQLTNLHSAVESFESARLDSVFNEINQNILFNQRTGIQQQNSTVKINEPTNE
ncbi:Hypothetical_protein [Hexamita inflata]|uniref:Hypothetical_protein n=1 Tax=Hexamita inflata TaxID=28002 RepID=A0AA86UAR8_9EUKA|nr:Hypothetical protein HINF_LOCUS37965 [Hexamita inflata]